MQFTELDLNNIAIQLGCLAVFREDGYLLWSALALLSHLDRLAPSGMLLVINLAKVEHLALHHPIAATAPVLDDAPITVFFAILEAFCRTQKHAHSLTNQ